LVTAPDIIFFWVARMIMAGMEYKQEIPFKQVYFTGVVRDAQGRKMSKQLGNSPDLLKLIEDHGADAVRFGVMIAAPAGNDLLFDVSGIEQGEKFINKIWNALKLLKMFEEKEGEGAIDKVNFAHVWFENKLEATKADVEKDLSQFKLSEALKKIYSLIWNDYCSWYLEFIKPSFEGTIDATSLRLAKSFLEELLKLLHPYMPFVTEEMYHLIEERSEHDDLMTASLANAKSHDKGVIEEGSLLQAIITQVRDARNKNGLGFKQEIELHLNEQDKSKINQFHELLASQVNATKIHYINEDVSGINFVVKDIQGTITADVEIDTTSQLEQLNKDLKQAKGFLISVEKKLGNERFVQNAKPEIVEIERKKKADAEEKIKLLEESIAKLN
jgi:valyl-tRNA synthetase